MRNFSVEIDIAAPADRVHAVMVDVERWPAWTASVRSLILLTPGPLTLGSQVRILQPRLPPATWTVTELSSRSFTWESLAPGLRVIARHSVTATPHGTRARLSLRYLGPVGGVIALLIRGVTERYLAMEAGGLKAESER